MSKPHFVVVRHKKQKPHEYASCNLFFLVVHDRCDATISEITLLLILAIWYYTALSGVVTASIDGSTMENIEYAGFARQN